MWDRIKNNMIVQPFWKAATWWGMRRMISYLPSGGAYEGTLFHFDHNDNKHEPCVALTIDDGLARGGPSTSMVDQVLQVLSEFNATATFFVCTDYVTNGCEQQALDLLQHGHELANHMLVDRSAYYPFLTSEKFATELQKANEELDKLEEEAGVKNSIRWFRAPQGVMTLTMRQALEQSDRRMISVLGDCYCDDWQSAQVLDRLLLKSSSQDVDTLVASVMDPVAELMLQQAQPGSIAIFHMPEKEFRQGTLYALQKFLQGLQAKGWKCCSLSDMMARGQDDWQSDPVDMNANSRPEKDATVEGIASLK